MNAGAAAWRALYLDAEAASAPARSVPTTCDGALGAGICGRVVRLQRGSALSAGSLASSASSPPTSAPPAGCSDGWCPSVRQGGRPRWRRDRRVAGLVAITGIGLRRPLPALVIGLVAASCASRPSS